MYLTTDNLAHYLIARGIIARTDIIAGDFVAVETSRRNRNFRVLRRRPPSLFVKQVPTIVTENIGTIRREAECCRLMAELAELAALQPFVPRLVDFSDLNHVLVTQFAREGENLNEYHFRTQAFSEWIGRLQGQTLGTIHAVTANALAKIDAAVTLPRAKPWFLFALHYPQMVLPDMSATMREAIQMLRQLPDVMAALSVAQSDWTPSCLCHNDVKWDNLLVVPQGDSRAVMLIDWELADIGDPCWDVASILTAYLQYWLFYIHSNQGPDGGRGKLAELQSSVAAFWNEYRRCTALTAADSEQLLTRSIFRAGIRLLQTVIETQGVASSSLPTTPLLLSVARHIFANVQFCRKDIFGFAAAEVVAPGEPNRLGDWPPYPSVTPVRPAANLSREPDDAPHPDLRETLRSICASVQIDSPVSLRVADAVVTVPPPGGHAAVAGSHATLRPADSAAPPAVSFPAGETNLVEALWPILYQNFYTSGGRPSGQPYRVTAFSTGDPQPDSEFLDRLSAANRTADGWDVAWQIYKTETNGSVHVKKGEWSRLVLAGGYAADSGKPVAIGDQVSVRRLRQSHDLVPGFYFAFSSAVGGEFDEGLLCRLYFNVSPDGACVLIDWLTDTLNRFEVPFRFKCLDRRSAYESGRADSAVLFIARRYAEFAVRAIAADYDALSSALRPSTPLFAKRLAPGISIADDPRTGESFGQSRMRLVSRGIVQAWHAGRVSADARLSAVLATFREAGLSLLRPHLNPGNADLGEWPT